MVDANIERDFLIGTFAFYYLHNQPVSNVNGKQPNFLRKEKTKSIASHLGPGCSQGAGGGGGGEVGNIIHLALVV